MNVNAELIILFTYELKLLIGSDFLDVISEEGVGVVVTIFTMNITNGIVTEISIKIGAIVVATVATDPTGADRNIGKLFLLIININ
jgi:hypothetical protein